MASLPYPAVVRGRAGINFDALNKDAQTYVVIEDLPATASRRLILTLKQNEMILFPIYIKLFDAVNTIVNVYLGTNDDLDAFAAFLLQPGYPHIIQADMDTPGSLAINTRALLSKYMTVDTKVYLVLTTSGPTSLRVKGQIMFTILRKT